jgi:mono/diheme cytochrome c family protein
MALVAAAVCGAGIAYAAGAVSLSASDDPDRLETVLALRAKRWFIGRAARSEHVRPPSSDDARAARGGMFFRANCASCHGIDGRTPTEIGRFMYPRVPDLGTPATQSWSDQELFWIVKNGIRLTGMPAFGPAYSADQLWDVVLYVRDIGREARVNAEATRF